MNDERETWQPDVETATGTIGVLRVTLIFGSAAVAMALILTPIIEDSAGSRVAEAPGTVELDPMSTGSIGRGESYTVRKSVLQRDPSSECIIRADGTVSGDC